MTTLLWIAGALALAGAVSWLVGFAGYGAKLLPSGAFSAKEQRVIAAAADAVFPARGPIPVSGTEAGLLPYLDRYLRNLPRGPAVLLHLLFHFVEHAPWIWGPRRVRFTRQTPEQQRAYLAHMSGSDLYFLRVSFTSMRALFTMAYLADPRVAEAMGIRQLAAPFEAPLARAS